MGFFLDLLKCSGDLTVFLFFFFVIVIVEIGEFDLQFSIIIVLIACNSFALFFNRFLLHN